MRSPHSPQLAIELVEYVVEAHQLPELVIHVVRGFGLFVPLVAIS